MTAPPDDLFERARALDLVKVVEKVSAVTLYKSGRRWRGECPICGSGAKKRAGGPFSVDPDADLFICFSCDKRGGAIELVREMRGLSAREAAAWLVGDEIPGDAQVRERPKTAAETPNDHRKFAERLWRESQPASASPVRAYLASRGITGRVAALALGRLRYHPEAFWGVDDNRQVILMPAMIARPVTPSGPTGGVHVTYLAAGGAGKTWRQPAKRMWGPQTGPEGPGGCWLIVPASDRPTIVGEGIESTLAAAMLLGAPCAAVATLSLRALQGGIKADRWGRVDPDLITGDPESPAFTWPKQTSIRVAVDRDMKPLKVKCRRATGGTYERELSPDDRARLCGGLAEAAWRRAGATDVRCLAPAAGRDFNDELLARTA